MVQFSCRSCRVTYSAAPEVINGSALAICTPDPGKLQKNPRRRANCTKYHQTRANCTKDHRMRANCTKNHRMRANCTKDQRMRANCTKDHRMRAICTKHQRVFAKLSKCWWEIENFQKIKRSLTHQKIKRSKDPLYAVALVVGSASKQLSW